MIFYKLLRHLEAFYQVEQACELGCLSQLLHYRVQPIVGSWKLSHLAHCCLLKDGYKPIEEGRNKSMLL